MSLNTVSLTTIIYYCHTRLLLNQMNCDEYKYKTNLLYSDWLQSWLVHSSFCFLTLKEFLVLFIIFFISQNHRMVEARRRSKSLHHLSSSLLDSSVCLLLLGGISGQSTPNIFLLLKIPVSVSTKPKCWCCVLLIAIVNLRLVIFLNSLLFVMFPKCISNFPTSISSSSVFVTVLCIILCRRSHFFKEMY